MRKDISFPVSTGNRQEQREPGHLGDDARESDCTGRKFIYPIKGWLISEIDSNIEGLSPP